MSYLLTKPTFLEVSYICSNMRSKDREEIMNLRQHDNEYQLAWEIWYMVANKGRGRVSWVNGRPAVFGSFTEMHNGVWEIGFFGTDDLKKGMVPMMRWLRQEAKSLLSDVGGHRLHCDSRWDYDDAHKLITTLGGKQESVMRNYGKDGSDYIRFVWLPENDGFLHKNYVPDKEAAE